MADWIGLLMDVGTHASRKMRETLTWAYFFGVTGTLAACFKLPDGDVDSGKIESVSFVSAPARHAVRIVVTARLGKAAIPDRIFGNCHVLQDKLRIATVRRRYEFLFDGRRVVPSRTNPPTRYEAAIGGGLKVPPPALRS